MQLGAQQISLPSTQVVDKAAEEAAKAATDTRGWRSRLSALDVKYVKRKERADEGKPDGDPLPGLRRVGKTTHGDPREEGKRGAKRIEPRRHQSALSGTAACSNVAI